MPNLGERLRGNVTCRQFARQAAAGFTLERSLYRRFHFRLHWLVCPFCRRYEKEIRAMGREARRLARLDRHLSVHLQEAKSRLKNRLRQRLT